MNHEPTGTRTTYCAACGELAAITNPISLCGTCSLRVMAAYAAANLTRTTGQVRASEPADPETIRRFQEAVTVSLYLKLNRRPEWTEIVGALKDANLPAVSRPTAQRIRERVESAHPELPRERRQTLTAND